MKMKANITSITPDCGEVIVGMSLQNESTRGALGIAIDIEKCANIKELEDRMN